MKKIVVIIMHLSIVFTSLSSIFLESINGKEIIDLNKIKKPLYIKVWATWCHHCKSSMNKLDMLSKRRDIDYNVISVVLADGKRDISKENFIELWKYDYSDYKNIKVYFDINDSLVKKIKIKAFPTNIFFDKNGKVFKVIPGVIENYKINKIMENNK